MKKFALLIYRIDAFVFNVVNSMFLWLEILPFGIQYSGAVYDVQE